MYTAALRGTRLREARLIFICLLAAVNIMMWRPES